MPLRFRARILDHLSHDSYRPADAAEVARQLRVEREDRPAFDEAVDQLATEGVLEVGEDERLRLPRLGDVVEGVIKITTKGFGFVVPETPTRDGDLFVPAGQTGNALSGDRVRCQVVRRSGGWGFRGRSAPGRGAGGGRGRDAGAAGAGGAGGGSRPVGRVVEVLERRQQRFPGTLIKDGRQWMVMPDGRRLREPILVRDPHARNATAGTKVVVELVAFPTEVHAAEGVIVEVLGEAGRPDVETQAVIHAFGLREGFPAEAMEEARLAAEAFERRAHGPWPDRLDLTGELTFTIDPPDARDFDDAISIRHDEATDEWTLGVHIADVSAFVPPGGALDREARERGTSVYLPRHVIPMLPETLSNGICSLQEGVPRFTKSVFITFDGRGRPGAVRTANAVIRSTKRLTYLEAQHLIDGHTAEAARHARTETEPSDAVVAALRKSDQLARLLQKRRRGQGMISLELPQVELRFDDQGHVVDAVPEDDAFTHKLIEMFMVEANEAIARVFADLNLPLLRRIHPDPGFADLEELRTFARIVQFRLPEEPTRQDLQALLEATRHRDDTRAVHFAVLRTLAKATYSPALVGHYALASDHYAHFTSPIRRYPDLSVHRALEAWLETTSNGADVPGGRRRREVSRVLSRDPRVPDEQRLLELGRHCTDREISAEDAERDLRTFLVLQLLHEKHMGDVFPAVVTGLLGSSAVFVSLEKFLVDGVVRLEASVGGRSGGKPERWTLNERSGRLVALRSGASVGLGDLLKVGIIGIDLGSRSMELALAEPLKVRAEGDANGGAAPAAGGGHRGTGGRRVQEGDGTGGPGGRDPRRDILSRNERGRFPGKGRGFKQGRRGRRG